MMIRDNGMFFGVFIDDNNKEMFLEGIDSATLGSADVWVGLVKEETDTACGVLGARSVIDNRNKLALSIRYVKVAEDYNERDVVTGLLRFLCDIAADIRCSTVSFTKEVPEEGEDKTVQLLSEIGFFSEDKKYPKYGFKVSDITVWDLESDTGSTTLGRLSEDQWKGFVEDTKDYSFSVSKPSDYDENLSVFLTDDKKDVQGGMLLSDRGDRLFVDGIAAYGSDEAALINDLVYWGRESAKKKYGQETEVNIILPADRTVQQTLMKVTGNKAERVAKLTRFTYDVPV